MKASDLKQKYLDFFVKKGHKVLPNVSLVPEDISSSALFISAGMHPLIPYLLGEPHPLGKRLVSNQRCLRTGDIEEVGDPHHLTFFEMLGNWSLGDYWKQEAISWSWEFLTKVLDLPIKRLSVSCFAGDEDAPKDEESAKIWQKLGIPKERIFFFGKKENWWGPVEVTGPCGPDSEMFIDMGGKCRLGKKNCNPSCQCGRFFEIWNDVFMQYDKTINGKYKPLKQKNVDTGMGVERTLSVLQEKDDIFLIEKLEPIIRKVEKISGKKYQGENIRPMRIIAEHFRAAAFLIADGVIPSNIEQGYVLRRLIRRAIRHGRPLQLNEPFAKEVAKEIIALYGNEYPFLIGKEEEIFDNLTVEEKKFFKVLDNGINELKKIFGKAIDGVDPENLPKGMIIRNNVIRVDGNEVFRIYETYGFHPELSQEIMAEWGLRFDDETMRECKNALEKHQEISRASVAKKFSGGLADHSMMVTRLHTATHLLHQALRNVLGDYVHQVGSNITPERLRFDFTQPDKLTEEQLKQVEKIINEKIKADLPVKMEMMSLEEAKRKGAMALFGEKYGEQVKTYSIGPSTDSTGSPQDRSLRLRSGRAGLPFSMEVCGGPHVSSTGEIGGVKIIKEKAVGTGRRRIYAKLTKT